MKLNIESPFHQASMAGSLILIACLVDSLLKHDETFIGKGTSTWTIATSIMLCFSFYNALVSLKIDKIVAYWRNSVFSLLGLMTGSYILCYLITGIHIDEAGTFRWLWLVILLTWAVFFAIARSIKRIIEIANKQDQDWHE